MILMSPPSRSPSSPSSSAALAAATATTSRVRIGRVTVTGSYGGAYSLGVTLDAISRRHLKVRRGNRVWVILSEQDGVPYAVVQRAGSDADARALTKVSVTGRSVTGYSIGITLDAEVRRHLGVGRGDYVWITLGELARERFLVLQRAEPPQEIRGVRLKG